jgi:hypothetical protein
MQANKLLGAVGLVGAVSFGGAEAAAQGAPTGVAISAERAFSIANTSETTELGGDSATTSTTDVGLGLNFPTATPSLTRVGIDYLMDGGLSIGAGIGFASVSLETESEFGGTSTTSEGPTLSAFVFAPRIGYALMFTESVGLWPRGGITYASLSRESTDTDIVTGAETTIESSESDLFLTLEAPLLILPVPSFGFLIAPTLDYSLSHTAESDGTESDADVSVTAFGLRFGVVGVL